MVLHYRQLVKRVQRVRHSDPRHLQKTIVPEWRAVSQRFIDNRVLRASLVTLCSHKSGRCTVELYHASHLWYPLFYTSPISSSALQH